MTGHQSPSLRKGASSSLRVLATTVSSGLVGLLLLAQPSSAQAASIERRADSHDSAAFLLGGKAPADAVILVCGGLGVSVACLCFILIRVSASNKSFSAGSRRLVEERHKAQTDLRVRGHSSPQQMHQVDRGIGGSNTPDSPTSLPLVDSISSDGAQTPIRQHRNSRGGVPPTKNPRGYSGSSFSRASGGEMSYNSYSSLMEVPMLGITGRMNTTTSQGSIASNDKDAAHARLAGLTQPNKPVGPRRPKSQLMNRPDSFRNSIARGSNVYLYRTGSGANSNRFNLTYHESGTSPVDGPVQLPGGSDLRRYHSESRGQSRRNSASGLLDDDRLGVGSSNGSAYHSPGESSSSHSSGLLPASQHPLSSAAAETATAAPQRQASLPRSNPPAHGVQGHYVTSNHWKATGQQPPQAPRQGGSEVPLYPGQAVSSSGHRSQRSDVESAGAYDAARSGQFTQPVAAGDGRRNNRGHPAGSRPMS